MEKTFESREDVDGKWYTISGASTPDEVMELLAKESIDPEVNPYTFLRKEEDMFVYGPLPTGRGPEVYIREA